MLDQPSVDELLAVVADWLRDTAAPQLPAHASFHARVAANALELVRRELSLGDAARAGSLQRLRSLLGRDGSLADLDAELARRIRTRELDPDSPALIEHLMADTLAKMAIDQPSYASYRRELTLHPQPKD